MKHKFTVCHTALISVLKKARTEAGLLKIEAGARLKRPHNFVGEVEYGRRALNVCEFVEYVEALGQDPMQVFAMLLAERAALKANPATHASVSRKLRTVATVGRKPRPRPRKATKKPK